CAVGGVSGAVGLVAGLVLCRSALGVAEAGGIPAAGKAGGLYLLPQERALGAAGSQVGLTLGIVSAPLLTVWLSSHFGWRATFVVAGALGLVWVPLWLVVSKAAPILAHDTAAPQTTARELIADSRWWWLL